MGYNDFAGSPKALIRSEDIGPGQIDLAHLSPELFSAIRQITLHSHTGTKSKRIEIADLTGAFPKTGFVLYSSDGTKKWRMTVDNTGAWVATDIT